MSGLPADGRLKESHLAARGPRVQSVDILRGITILLMVFVNDLGRAAPAWLHHIQPPDADGMTVADVVFPWFLFIVGVSIPLALESARRAGVTTGRLLAGIIIRTIGLLVMGVIVMNSEDDVGSLGPQRWELGTSAAILLAWLAIPRRSFVGKWPFIVLKAVGILGLAFLLAVYRHEPSPAQVMFVGDVDNWVWLRSGWWGILGLIGWAYLTGSLLTLLLGGRREWLMGALAVLMLLHLAMAHGGLFTRVESKPWLGAAKIVLQRCASWIDAIQVYLGLGDATGSLASITLAGCLLGTTLRRDNGFTSAGARVRWTATLAVGLFIAGCVTDTLEGINKIGSTPTWCLWSASLACWLWILIDRTEENRLFAALYALPRAAGRNALVAYFLHPIAVNLLPLIGLGHILVAYQASADPIIVIAGSLAMSVTVCLTAGLLGYLGFRVRL